MNRKTAATIKAGDRVTLTGPAHTGPTHSYTVLGVDRSAPTGPVFSLGIHFYDGQIGSRYGYRLVWPAGPNATGGYDRPNPHHRCGIGQNRI